MGVPTATGASSSRCSGGAAAAWPLAARAQQGERMRRIGVLIGGAESDPVQQARLAAFLEGLQQLGWTDGRNVRIDIRWCGGQCGPLSQIRGRIGWHLRRTLFWPLAARAWRRCSRQAAARRSCSRMSSIRSAQGSSRAWRSRAATPPGSSRSNTASAGNGWSCSKRSRPDMTRAAVLRDPALAAGIGQFAAIQSMAPSSAVELSAIDMRDAGEIERAVVAFARKPNGGLVVTASASALIHRDLIIALATRLRLPNVYPFRYYPSNGGLPPTGLIRSTSSGARLATSIASSRARSLPTFRCRRRPSTSWSST